MHCCAVGLTIWKSFFVWVNLKRWWTAWSVFASSQMRHSTHSHHHHHHHHTCYTVVQVEEIVGLAFRSVRMEKPSKCLLSCTGIRAHIHEYYEISSILYLSFFLSKCLFLSLLLSIPCSTHTPIVASFFSCAYNFSTVSLCLYALFSLYIYRIFLTPFGVSSTYFFDSQSGIGVVCKAIFHLHLL